MAATKHPTPRNFVSPGGVLIATFHISSITISSYTGAIVRSISLNPLFISKCHHIHWWLPESRIQDASEKAANEIARWPSARILLANDDTIRLYDVNDTSWSATIEKAASNLGRIADVAFGRTKDELIVLSDFGVKLTIWSLITCRGIEIRDPKYMACCYDFRPRTGHMAVLARPAAQDILMLLQPGNCGLIKSVELPTIDAQEVIWSPDGHWLLVRDTASNGCNILIHTADGQLFKTYDGKAEPSDISQGVKCLSWGHEFGLLAVGHYDGTISILNKNTFTSTACFQHQITISLPQMCIWQEQLDPSGERSYAIAPQPANPPLSPENTKANSVPYGISILAFNSDGTRLATKYDAIPTTIWVWSMHSHRISAVIIHHSSVKYMEWHPSQSDLLLIHCNTPEPAIHLWKSSWDIPRVVRLPLARPARQLEAKWVKDAGLNEFEVILCSAHEFKRARVSDAGCEVLEPAVETRPTSPRTCAEDLFDEGNSLDLSPIKLAHDETMELRSEYDGKDRSFVGFDLGNEMVDDTFHYRRRIRAPG